MAARTFNLSNWMDAPYNRAAFQHVRELVPTALIRNRSGRINPLEVDGRPLDELRYKGPDGGERKWGQHLVDSC
ncbi:MAG: hypothetical protein WCC60_16560, partial [Ilumatobacteraceae bacterium]